jgi:sugar phosphate isomerase/epimerase
MDIPEWAREAKRLGFDGFDISVMFLKNRTPAYLVALKKELAEIGLPPVMMTDYPDFTHPNPLQRERELAYLTSDVALCSELGVKYLRILAGQAHPGMGIEEGVDLVADYFHKIDPWGKKFGVELVYEDHAKPGAWDYIDFSYPPDIFLQIFRRIQDTGIRVNFDTGNIVAWGMDPMEILPEIVDKISTIHVTDMAEKGRFSPVGIGDGVVPNREIFSFLKKHGFNGWLCIEEASGRGLEGVRLAHDFVRSAWDAA